MKTIYAVRAVAVRDEAGAIAGWVRADPRADGSRPADTIFLRDGTSCGQATAMKRIARDPGLLYPSDEEAVRDGIERLLATDRLGALSRVCAWR